MFTEVSFKIGNSFKQDYTRSALITEIAKEAKVNHRTVKNHIKMLEKLNILETNTKGKMTIISPKKTNQFYKFIGATENYFSFSDTRPEILKLHQRFKGKFCIVFGSFAMGEEDELSDIDIVCDMDFEDADFFHKPQIFKFKTLKEIPDSLFREIQKKHIIIEGVDAFIDEVRRRG